MHAAFIRPRGRRESWKGLGDWDWDEGGRLSYVCLSANKENCDKIRPCFWPFFRRNVQRIFFFYCTKLHDKHRGVVGGRPKRMYGILNYLEWARKLPRLWAGLKRLSG